MPVRPNFRAFRAQEWGLRGIQLLSAPRKNLITARCCYPPFRGPISQILLPLTGIVVADEHLTDYLSELRIPSLTENRHGIEPARTRR